MSDTPDSVVRAYIHGSRDAFLDDLGAFPDERADQLRVPSVPARPGHGADVRRGAVRLAAKLKEAGFTATRCPSTGNRHTPGAPAVVADGVSHDPADPADLAVPAVLVPVLRDGRRCAWGAAAEEGQVFFDTLGVRAPLIATGRTTPAGNLRLLAGGDEEPGSPGHGRSRREQDPFHPRGRLGAGRRPPGHLRCTGAAPGHPRPSDGRQTPNEKIGVEEPLLGGVESTGCLRGDLATALR
jgi:acetylornithine deacetylase/succinyl-diaminopimelate desuccinylase-like protein